jgi:hypothetical protein
MRNTPLVCVVYGVLAVGLAGCGSAYTRSEDQVQSAQETLTTALDAWKNGEIAKVKVNFSDDLLKTHTLVEYAIGESSVPDERTIAFNVTLTLKDRRGKVDDRVVVYLVMPDRNNLVTRDPYQ